jgi:excisionase family DNA binding protein
MIKGYLTTGEVAERLGVTVGRVRQLVAEKRLPAVKVGRDNLIQEKHLAKIQTYGKAGRPRKEIKQ